MGSFLDSLRQDIDRLQAEVNTKILTYVAQPFFTRIVQNSPSVGNGMTADGPYVTGCFANNWFPAVNSYDSSTSMSVSTGGRDSILRIDGVVNTAKTFYQKDGFVTLSNNLSYGYRVEYGWPQGTDPISGWHWTGNARIYAPVANSATFMKAQLNAK